METTQPIDNFVLSEGGLSYRFLKLFGLHDKPVKLVIIGLFMTWVPLLILCALAGTVYRNTEMPFLKDYAMQARLLVTIPILILTRPFIDQKVNVVMKYLSDALMGPEDRHEILSTAFARAKKLTNSGWTETVMLLLVIITSAGLFKGGVYSGLTTGTSWMANTSGTGQTLSLAGYWAVLFCIPLNQFLLYRWLWRYIVWVMILFRLARTKLNLLPTHADRAGGLGIIMIAQNAFNMVFVAGSVTLSGQFIADLLQHPDDFMAIRNQALAYVVLCIILLLFPLLFFMGKLFKLKNGGFVSMSNLGAKLSRKFENEWINDQPVEKIPTSDMVNPSMIYDYAGMYDYLQQVRPLPVNIRDIITMAIVLIAPFLPILFVKYSVAEIAQNLAKMLL